MARIERGLSRRGFLASAAQGGRAPNVVIVLADDQGYGDLSCHGNPAQRTPHLDAMHRESIRFEDFHAAPMCTPTRGQLLTGRDAFANGASSVSSGRAMFHRDLPTLPGIFARAGYRTAIFGKWHCGDMAPYRPQDRGFQKALWHPGYGLLAVSSRWNNDYFDPYLLDGEKWRRYEGYCTDVLFAEAMRWMQERGRAREPFLAYLPMVAPHAPLFAPERYREPYRNLPPRLKSFFAMIANLDENFGRLEAFLKRAGLRENTIVIFATDNGSASGTQFFNSGMKGRKRELYDGGHRVPCFLRWPAGGLRPPGAITDLTQFQDLLPTLAGLCGVRLPGGMKLDGVSLEPSLRGRAQPDLASRMAVVQYSQPDGSPPAKGDAAVLWNRWRLVRGEELYDIGADPGQARDLAKARPEILGRLRDHYAKWWDGVKEHVENLPPLYVGGAGAATELHSSDWIGPATDEQMEIREGVNQNGPWNLFVERAGRYRIALRRWPRDTGAPITAGLPAIQYRDGAITGWNPGGKALPIASAAIAVSGLEPSVPVRPGDQQAVIDVALRRGPARLRSSFRDADGRELCGAYFASVEEA